MSETLPPSERRTRRHQQGARSREEIIDAATALMSTKGFSATSISDLARMSGLPASSIYWHFESKAGVLAAVMERGARRFFDAIGSAVLDGSVDPRARLLAVMAHSERSVREHPEFLRLFMLLLLGSEGGPAQEEVVDRVRSEGRDHLHDTLLHAYAPWGEAVAARIADDLVDVLFALFDGIFVASQTRNDHPQDAIVVQLVDAVHALACDIHPGSQAT